MATLTGGAPGFFTPRSCRHSCRRPARPRPRASTIRARSGRRWSELVDFDRINAGAMRFSVGAVNVRTGNFEYFDTATPPDRPGAHHGQRRTAARLSSQSRSTASTTGTAGWSPTRRCNGCSTPCRARTRWPSRSICGAPRGEFPRDLIGLDQRQKDIRFSSRTRANTDQFKSHPARCAARCASC